MDALDARQSLENGEFVPYFQPIVALRTGQLAGFEILARWIHPTLGMIQPDEFIARAEKNGWIGALTQKLMESAFLSARLIPAPVTLSINVSTVQLRDRLLPEQVKRASELTGFSLDRLIVEITESALSESVIHSSAICRELKAMGCRIALDDFGTGYSSLLHLQSLPFDELKVDRSFVSSMGDSRQSRKIVSAVVGLGQSLGLKTVAEGIESQEQAEMLLWLGCELGQGWFYGRPAPASQLEETIVASQHWTPLKVSPQWQSGFAGNIVASPTQRMAHLQAVYDGAPVGLGFLDCDLRYVNLNKKLADMNHSTVEEHLGARVKDMVPTIFPAVEGYLNRALHGEAITDVEAVLPATNSAAEETRLVSYQPARDEAGEVVGVSVAVVDITERKRAEAALQESEEHYRNMVELNPQTLWVMDCKGHSLDVTPRGGKATGLLKQHTGDHCCWLDSVHPDDYRSTVDSIAYFMYRGVPLSVEYRARTGSGAYRWMRSCGSPRFDDAGKIVCWYGSVEDIDDLKQAQQLLQSTEAKLEALVLSTSNPHQPAAFA